MNKYAIYCDSLEDEQLLKDWIKKESDLKCYNDTEFYFKKYYFHFPANNAKVDFLWGSHSWSTIQTAYTKINIKDFLKEYHKMNKTELLGLPIIKGEKHHLEAFGEDLKKIGFQIYIGTSIYKNWHMVHNNLNESAILKDEVAFKTMCIVGDELTYYDNSKVKPFQLPQDWSKALGFMKDNMDRWNKIQEENKQPEFKVGDWVYADKSLIPKGEDYRESTHIPVFQIKEIHNSCWLRPEENNGTGVNIKYCRKATPQEIEEYNNKLKIFKMTSSSGDFELEVSKKGIYYRPEDSWVDPTSIEKMLLSAIPVYGKFNSQLPLHTYTMEFETVKVGCKSGCSVKAWKEVYDYYKSLQNENKRFNF